MEKITLRQIEFVEKMLRQIKQLAEEYYEYFYLDVAVLIDVIKKVNIAKIVRNLSGVMTGRNFWCYYEGAGRGYF